MLMNSGKDIAISVIPQPRGDRPTVTFTGILMANFDNIVDLSFRDNEDGKREWFYRIYRWRGIESNDYSDQPNNGDPFAIIERTGGKPIREYMLRVKDENGNSKRMFVNATSKDEAIAQAEQEGYEVLEVLE